MSEQVTADETPTVVTPLVEPDQPLPARPAPPADLATEHVTCPECGTSATVTLNRREASDFCRQCDFPLFWTPNAVLRDPSAQTAADALRRLPGTVGRATVAAQPCPHCAEPNAVSAQVCVRCGRPMHLEVSPPPPAAVHVAPPTPVEVEEPAHRIAWWIWLLLGLGLALAVTLAVLFGTGTLG